MGSALARATLIATIKIRADLSGRRVASDGLVEMGQAKLVDGITGHQTDGHARGQECHDPEPLRFQDPATVAVDLLES